ncbi:MAG: zf-HC2 domain-containing protein [Gemmatimonadota bacterium]
MKTCAHIQTEISALLDGESDPKTALDLLEHVSGCHACGAFVREARRAQVTIDVAFPAADPALDALVTALPQRGLARVPRWALAMAATVVVAVGGALVSQDAPVRTAAETAADNGIVLHVGTNDGEMNDERFIELATELLAADRLYRDEMYSVLEAVRNGEPRDERSTPNEAAPTEGGLYEQPLRLTANALD